MLRVGLTGGIACGKSHVLAHWAATGFYTLDLDRVAHELMAPGGRAYAEVVAAFGPSILSADGAIDRKALGARVFADPEARRRLGEIVHPRVREEEERRVRGMAGAAGRVVVTDAALLIESGIHLRFDRLVVVHCSPEEQLRRLMARDGIDAAAARARIDAQMPVAEKRRFAHFELDSSGTEETTAAAADRLALELARLADTTRGRVTVGVESALGCLKHGPARGPRGLDPATLVSEIASARGIELERLARRLVPPSEGPWYRAAESGSTQVSPATLAGPLALWAASHRGEDADFLAAAAAALARLTHGAPEAIADAVLIALALLETAGLGATAERRVEAGCELAARWAGAPPSAVARATVEQAASHPRDLGAARAGCLRAGGDVQIVGSFVGWAIGATAADAPQSLVRDVQALLFLR